MVGYEKPEGHIKDRKIIVYRLETVKYDIMQIFGHIPFENTRHEQGKGSNYCVAWVWIYLIGIATVDRHIKQLLVQ